MLVFTPWILLFGAATFAAPVELTCRQVQDIQNQLLARHLVYSSLTPELEKRVRDQFLQRIDDSKLYLLKPDHDAAEKSLARIFSKIANGDCNDLTKANEVVVGRIAEREALARKYLGEGFKLDRKATYQTDPKKRTWPASKAAAEQVFKAQIQFDVANYVSSGIGLEAAKRHVLKNYERIANHARKQTDKDVLSWYLDSFATSLDPHSNYMPPEAQEDFDIQMKLALEGIGAALLWRNGFTVIDQLLPGGAALASGLVKPHDKIVAVAQGKDGPFVDVIEMELRDVIKLIRGPKGSTVRLKLVRKVKNEVQNLEVALARDKITLEDQSAFIRYFDRKIKGRAVKVAFLNLPSFYDDQIQNGKSANSDLKKLLNEAVANKTDVLVLDLSINGGGSLQDAVEVGGLFFPEGNVVKVGRHGQFQVLQDDDKKTYWTGPLVILTSRVSASASEIVAGTLQSYHRAVIVGGDQTYGKGTVQAVEQLAPGLGALKTTTAMFYTAGGSSTQHRGVSGDIVFPSYLTRDQVGEKSMDYSLPPQTGAPFLSPSAYVMVGPQRWDVVNEDVIKSLRAKAQIRIKANPDFKKIQRELKKPKPSTLVTIESLLKGKDPNSGKDDDEDEEKDDPRPNRDERIKEYLKRAEAVEAVNVAADLVIELTH